MEQKSSKIQPLNLKLTLCNFFPAAVVQICCVKSESMEFSVLPRNVAISTELLQFLQLEQGMIVSVKCHHQRPSSPVGVVLTLHDKEVRQRFSDLDI